MTHVRPLLLHGKENVAIRWAQFLGIYVLLFSSIVITAYIFIYEKGSNMFIFMRKEVM